jgi:hypothetical protein
MQTIGILRANSKATEFSKAKQFTEALRLYGEAIAIAEVCRGLETFWLAM